MEISGYGLHKHPPKLYSAGFDRYDDDDRHGQYNCSLCGSQISDSITFPCFPCRVALCFKCVALRPITQSTKVMITFLFLTNISIFINFYVCRRRQQYLTSLANIKVRMKRFYVHHAHMHVKLSFVFWDIVEKLSFAYVLG